MPISLDAETIEKLNKHVLVLKARVQELTNENAALREENMLLSSAVDRLGREKIKEYLQKTRSPFLSWKERIRLERIGLEVANGSLLGIPYLVAALGGGRMIGPRSAELKRQMGQVKAHLVALRILEKHYDSNKEKVDVIAKFLFSLHFRVPCNVVEGTKKEKTKFQIPDRKYRDLDCLMTSLGTDVVYLKDRCSKKEYEEKMERKNTRMAIAQKALDTYYEQVFKMLTDIPKAHLVVTAYVDNAEVV